MMTKPANKRTAIILATIVFLLAGWLAWWQFYPRYLGDDLLYIEKRNFGCFLIFCDHRPYSEYYYETNMNIEELSRYFKKASPNKPAQREANAWQISLFNDRQNEGFTLYFYEKKTVTEAIGIKTTKNVVVVPDKYYELAKKSLD